MILLDVVTDTLAQSQQAVQGTSTLSIVAQVTVVVIGIILAVLFFSLPLIARHLMKYLSGVSARLSEGNTKFALIDRDLVNIQASIAKQEHTFTTTVKRQEKRDGLLLKMIREQERQTMALNQSVTGMTDSLNQLSATMNILLSEKSSRGITAKVKSAVREAMRNPTADSIYPEEDFRATPVPLVNKPRRISDPMYPPFPVDDRPTQKIPPMEPIDVLNGLEPVDQSEDLFDNEIFCDDDDSEVGGSAEP